jgi:hypothetical protein
LYKDLSMSLIQIENGVQTKYDISQNVIDIKGSLRGGAGLIDNSGVVSIIGLGTENGAREGYYYNFNNMDLSYSNLPEVSGNIIGLYQNGYALAVLTSIGKAYAFGGSSYDISSSGYYDPIYLEGPDSYNRDYYQMGTNTNDISNINIDISILTDDYIELKSIAI